MFTKERQQSWMCLFTYGVFMFYRRWCFEYIYISVCIIIPNLRSSSPKEPFYFNNMLHWVIGTPTNTRTFSFRDTDEWWFHVLYIEWLMVLCIPFYLYPSIGAWCIRRWNLCILESNHTRKNKVCLVSVHII